jgi:hypothetical protein
MNRVRKAIPNLLQRLSTPRRTEIRTLVCVIAALGLFSAVAASGLNPAGLTPTPYPSTTGTGLPAITSSVTPLTGTADPNTETNGIIFGGVILVIIIIGGTLQVLRPRSGE